MGKLIQYLIVIFSIVGCGYTSINNEAIGQFKTALQVTPLICPNRFDVDISLGVMINGVGSMSREDLWLTVESESLFKEVQMAVESGKIYKITFDTFRFVLCPWNHKLKTIELKE